MGTTAIEAACSRKYHAVHSSGQRSPSIIKWVVIHDEEAPTAESAASWFQHPESQGSAHLCVDDNICYRTLDNDEIPWGAASTFGANSKGFHIEMAGFAQWNSATWLLHRDTLKRAAYKTALHCKLFDLPVVWVPAFNLMKNHEGITSHAEVSKASRIQDPKNAWAYSHSDPGLFFPRRTFMNYVKGYFNELTT